MGISAGATVGAGVRVAGGTGGGWVLVTSNPARSMRVLRLLVELLPAADRRRALLGKEGKGLRANPMYRRNYQRGGLDNTDTHLIMAYGSL